MFPSKKVWVNIHLNIIELKSPKIDTSVTNYPFYLLTQNKAKILCLSFSTTFHLSATSKIVVNIPTIATK